MLKYRHGRVEVGDVAIFVSEGKLVVDPDIINCEIRSSDIKTPPEAEF